jgi:hypothetical protein
VERVRIRCVEEGFEAALRPRPSRQLHPRKLDGCQEAHLVALVCSPAPKGRKRWSLRLLADKLVELEVVDDISYETVRQTLKKTVMAPPRPRAARTESLRRLPPETVDDFRSGGFFRVLQPKRFGGMELDYGRVQLELCGTLGRACGSAAWVQRVVARATGVWRCSPMRHSKRCGVRSRRRSSRPPSASRRAGAGRSRAATGSRASGCSPVAVTCASGSFSVPWCTAPSPGHRR